MHEVHEDEGYVSLYAPEHHGDRSTRMVHLVDDLQASFRPF